ncbi:MAG TPA: ATP-binding cassette domain-containing protein [Candidatus Dormibacteraeota bacterium]|nr:ATP-binding cassette domain-containing protein [Candidatus Dormibacteraeota bacterium]
MAEVRFRDVRVVYPGSTRPAVDGITLEVPSGTLAVLLGPSGCGKTTLLRTVNRLQPIDAGSIAIGGRDVATLDPIALRRSIGYVIQAVGLFPHLTVGENVAVVPRLLGWARERIRARVDALLAQVSLDPQTYRSRYPSQLSGGQQQRVGIARALAAEPGILLMDEPFGAVDAIVRASLQEETTALQLRLGSTILFVTHDVEEALKLAHLLVVMRDGRIEQAGTPAELLAHPRTPFVAELLDARDALRRLSVMTIGDLIAAPPDGEPPPLDEADVPRLDAGASLREALGAMLTSGGRRVRVMRGGRDVTVLDLDDLRRALRP